MSDVTNESKRIRSSEDNTNNHQSFNQSIAKKKKTDNPDQEKRIYSNKPINEELQSKLDYISTKEYKTMKRNQLNVKKEFKDALSRLDPL